jgi:hypothetical protein
MRTTLLHFKPSFPSLALILIISCSENDADKSEIPADSRGNFFPLHENKEWQYEKRFFSIDEDSTLLNTQVFTETVDGDTVLDQMSYKVIVNENGSLVKIVRQEGTKFFGRNHELYGGFSHEYQFLDNAALDGETWSYLKDDGNTRTEYVVKQIHPKLTIGTSTFSKVLEVEANYYDKNADDTFALRYSTKHFYADGIGEVYAYYPYPASNSVGDLHVILVGYQE